MVGVVVATHGKLAEELVRTAEGVVGPLAHVKSVGVVASAPDVLQQVQHAIDEMEEGQGVLVLTDLFGGSPTNLCLQCLSSRHVEVITGVNLPMLLKLGSLRKDGVALEKLAHDVAALAQESIFLVSEKLRQRTSA
jgi:PTS system mannose-specific IIA component